MGINICYGNDSVRYGWMAASINTLISQADETVDVLKFKGRICLVSFTTSTSFSAPLELH